MNATLGTTDLFHNNSYESNAKDLPMEGSTSTVLDVATNNDVTKNILMNIPTKKRSSNNSKQ